MILSPEACCGRRLRNGTPAYHILLASPCPLSLSLHLSLCPVPPPSFDWLSPPPRFICLSSSGLSTPTSTPSCSVTHPVVFKPLPASLSFFRISDVFSSALRPSTKPLRWVFRPREPWLSFPPQPVSWPSPHFSASPPRASSQVLELRPVHSLFSAWYACPLCQSSPRVGARCWPPTS